MTNQKSKIITIFIIGFIFAYLPATSFAAKLYLEPEQGGYHQDDIFIVEIKLNTEDENINATKIGLTFPQNILEVKDFSKGDSILILWAQEPIFSNQTGIVYFTGGIPNGYQGKDGPLAKIVFQAKSEGEATVQFTEDSQVLSNDGLGTPARLDTEGATFIILSEKLEIPKDAWKDELKKDNISPELFEIEISKNPTIFEGKYFIAFSTIDKQTGIDYYEIREGDREWKRAQSPYLLENQSLRNKILVKAVDKAGNERIAEITPPYKIAGQDIVILFVIFIGILVIWWLIRKLKAKK